VEEAQKDRFNSVAAGVGDAEDEDVEGVEDMEGEVESQRKTAWQSPATMILAMTPIPCAFYPLLPAVESAHSTKGCTLPMVPPMPSTLTACTHA
jgi:hypothetical protein